MDLLQGLELSLAWPEQRLPSLLAEGRGTPMTFTSPVGEDGIFGYSHLGFLSEIVQSTPWELSATEPRPGHLSLNASHPLSSCQKKPCFSFDASIPSNNTEPNLALFCELLYLVKVTTFLYCLD